MLLDRGSWCATGPSTRPTGEVETLEVPETLHALIAARLDGVSPEERRVLQDGAVLGKTFSKAALSALSGLSEADLEPLLSSLARKEVLGVQSDPRSPEHGQYGFLQDLVRHVAYETLSKRERKARHLAAAAHLENVFADEDEVAEVLASHYLAAFDAAPDADDAGEIRAKACEMLGRAGERAGSLGAPDEGQRYFEEAAELADEPVDAGAASRAGGGLASEANRSAEARERLEQAIGLFEQAGDTRAAARASAALADVDAYDGRLDEAAARLEHAVAGLDRGRAGCRTRRGARAARPHACTRRAQRGGVAHARARVAAGGAPAAARRLRRGPHEQGGRPHLPWTPRRGTNPARGRCRPGVRRAPVRERTTRHEQPWGRSPIRRSLRRSARSERAVARACATARGPPLGVEHPDRRHRAPAPGRPLGRGPRSRRPRKSRRADG